MSHTIEDNIIEIADKYTTNNNDYGCLKSDIQELVKRVENGAIETLCETNKLTIEQMMREIASKLPNNYRFVITCEPTIMWFSKLFKVDMNAKNPRERITTIKIEKDKDMWLSLYNFYDWFMNDFNF